MDHSGYWQRKSSGTNIDRRSFLRAAALTGVGSAAFLAGCQSGPSKSSNSSAGASDGVKTGIWAVPEAKSGGTITELFSYEPTG